MIEIKVAEVLGKRRLNQRQACRLTGINPNTMSALWRGSTKRIDIEYLDKLCRALDCKIEDLLEYVPDTEHKDL